MVPAPPLPLHPALNTHLGGRAADGEGDGHASLGCVAVGGVDDCGGQHLLCVDGGAGCGWRKRQVQDRVDNDHLVLSQQGGKENVVCAGWEGRREGRAQVGGAVIPASMQGLATASVRACLRTKAAACSAPSLEGFCVKMVALVSPD